jgi:hypothetical protein
VHGSFKPGQEYYTTYRKDCTTHTTRNVVLAEIVLRNLREAIACVQECQEAEKAIGAA